MQPTIRAPAPDTAQVSERHYLAPLFEPSSIAVVGASEKPAAIGGIVFSNMLTRYRGGLFAVNPKYPSVHGQRCYPSMAELPQPVDLAIVATPAATVPAIIEDCGRARARTAIVITAGFSETGPRGAVLESELLANARRHGIRVLGPNCLGIMRPALGVNASFARHSAHAGSLALVSQSGAICTALLDWATPNGIGFSSILSLGGSTDVDFGEIIDYLAQDAATEHILLYIEGVRDGRRFVSALRAAARVKPVILMKAGRNAAGSRAAKSHTGAMVGSDDVFDAVVRRTGVVRVHTIGQLVAAAQALAARVKPQGNRLAVITNGGGPGVMAADYAGGLGIPLAGFTPVTIDALQRALAPNWSYGNPVDLIGDASAECYKAAVTACLDDANVDGALVLLAPQAVTDPTAAAAATIEAALGSRKPVIACWMGQDSVAEARRLYAQARIPVFRTPEPAVDMFAHVWAFYRNQRNLLHIPGPLAHRMAPHVAVARNIIENALADHRCALTQREAMAVLRAFRIPGTHMVLARSADEAVQRASEIGFPVALKIESPDIAHKSDVGGVRLNLVDAKSVHAAYGQLVAAAGSAMPHARINGVNVEGMVLRDNTRELMVGLTRDPVFGPAISFGAGGTMAEVLHDRAIGLPPLNSQLVSEMITGTRVSRVLSAFRNLPRVNMPALEGVILRISEIACELPWIEELDVNPLLVDERGAVALDARIVVAPRPASRDRYAHLAIAPYPAHLVTPWKLPNGTSVTLRPIRPEDAEIEQRFVQNLSPESRYFRFMGTLRELTPAMLFRFTQIDYDREMAFIAVVENDGRERAIGVARYITNSDGRSCEFAVVVAEECRRAGVGHRMMELLMTVARERGLETAMGRVLANNKAMLAWCRRIGCEILRRDDDEDETVRVALTLTGEAPPLRLPSRRISDDISDHIFPAAHQ